jgi:hypothetical protein
MANFRVFVLGFVVVSAVSANAGTILSNPPVLTNAGPGDLGESFTTPGGGPWNSIAFAFLQGFPASSPVASGDLFLLSQSYSGAPNALSSAAPGFLAESTGVSSGFWNFASSVILQPNTQYFVYMDSAGSHLAPQQGTALAGASGYLTFPSAGSYGLSPVLAFDLTGTAIPEPANLLLAATGMSLITAAARFARRTRKRIARLPSYAASRLGGKLSSQNLGVMIE